MDQDGIEMNEIKKVGSMEEFNEKQPYNILNMEERQTYLKISNADFINYKELFSLFDASGDGAIDQEEIGSLMQALGQNPTEEQIQKMMEEIDENSDG